ncbi:GAG-pre-integrase domain-containing protein, partial [Escherichia coli]|uniref:GAG-pre-integrase domain-containing protein n=1 Tax=Escherichia coli TaxID=562 RepID=UPI0024AA00FE
SVIEYNAPEPATSAFSSSHAPKTNTADEATWHKRLGHPSDEALRHIEKISNDIKIVHQKRPEKGEPKPICQSCAVSKSKRQISRRTPESRATVPFQRLYIDLLHVKPAGYNQDQWAAHFFCEVTKWHEIDCSMSKSMISNSIINKIRYIERQFGYRVLVIRIDVERSLTTAFRDWVKEEGITIEHSAEYTPEQNGSAERSGGILTSLSRTIRIEAKFPEEMWPEVIKTAVYIANRLPTPSLNWKSPLLCLMEHLSRNTNGAYVPKSTSLAHLRIIGCKAYVRDPKVTRGEKLAPRAHIGYLIGYDST